MKARASGELLEFLAPGFLHGLCNTLFKIQGQAQILAGRSPSRDSTQVGPHILTACREGVDAVEIFRLILDPGLSSKPVAAGPLLHGVARLVGSRLLDRGVQIEWDPELETLTHSVRRCDLVLPLVTAMHRLDAALPTGFEGGLSITARVEDDLEIQLELAPAVGCLPFDIDLSAAVRDAGASCGDSRVSARGTDLGIILSIPIGAIA